MMGDTGPCGPCSELHVDLTPAGDTRGSLVNAGDAALHRDLEPRFHPVQREPRRHLLPLPAQHVDTGMGFERVTSIIQGTKNFTDFSRQDLQLRDRHLPPDLRRDRKAERQNATARTLPEAGSTGDTEQEKIDVAFRVIADHIRTLSFAIADGIQPEQHGPQLRPAPHPPPRGALRAHARLSRAVLLQAGRRRWPNDGRSLSRIAREAVADQRDDSSAKKNRLTGRSIAGIELFEARSRRRRSSISGAFAFRLYDDRVSRSISPS